MVSALTKRTGLVETIRVHCILPKSAKREQSMFFTCANFYVGIYVRKHVYLLLPTMQSTPFFTFLSHVVLLLARAISIPVSKLFVISW